MKISLVKDSKAGALRAYFSLLQFVFDQLTVKLYETPSTVPLPLWLWLLVGA